MVEKILTERAEIAKRMDETPIFNAKLQVEEKPAMMKVSLKNIQWHVDPIQSFLMAIKAQKMPVYAEALNRNMTGLFFNYLDYKVDHREVITLEIKGQVRCLSTDTSIKTFKGNKITDNILSRLKKTVDVLSYNFKDGKFERAVAKVIDAGKKELYEIKTDSGKVINASAEHKFFVFNGKSIVEKMVKDIKKGDKIVTFD